MADLLKGLFGGAKSAVTSVASEADDFADFATAASPSAPSHAASAAFASATASSQSVAGVAGGFFSPVGGMQGRPYTKWYRVWERVTLRDFYAELFIMPVILVVILVNVYGSYLNKQRARQWTAAHLNVLDAEFAQVGFSQRERVPSAKGEGVEDKKGLEDVMKKMQDVDEGLLKQRGKHEYFTYATGRQNVGWVDMKLTLYKRFNPFLWAGEAILSFFFDSIAAPAERVEATAYVFDGKEKSLAPNAAGSGGRDSSFDGFVFAIVHKDKMKQLREDRYDISLTTTRDHQKLPDWATTMSESAEITEAMLTPELVKAVEECGEDLEALIVSDQPIDAPKKLNDTIPTKRISLSMRLNPNPSSTAILSAFLRLPDHLVSSAHFRPEAMRKVRATRENEMAKIRKVDEEEKAEERRNMSDKAKKEERERRLAGMKPEEQKKFLDKERAKETRKGEKKRTMRA